MSSRREATRIAILDAAWKRLGTPGDEARLEDVAADAGVTRQSVYLHFGSRGALLVALVEHVDQVLGLVELLRALDAVSDPVERLRETMRMMARYQPKIHGVAMALQRLAPTDKDAAAAFEDRMSKRLGGLEQALTAIAKARRLAPAWSVKRAAEALWAAGSPAAYEQLVVERGWSIDELERWLVHLVDSLVIGGAASPGTRTRRAPRAR